MQLIDPNHPAYRRLWVRIAIVAVCFAWATVEFVTGDPFWGVISGGAGAYAFYVLFWTFDPQPQTAEPVVQPDAEEEDEPGTATIVTPNDVNGDEPAADDEKKAEEKKAE